MTENQISPMCTTVTQRFAAAALIFFLCTAGRANASAEPPFFFEDLDRFAAAIEAVDGGTPLAEAMAGYVTAGSPGMQIFKSNFGLSAEAMVEKVTQRPRFYRYLVKLRPEIKALEPQIRAALAKLQASAPAGSKPVPLYFLVANMRAGGNPGVVQTPQGPRQAIAIGVDLTAMSPRVDMSEFPKGPAGTSFEDMTVIAVHETAHIFQAHMQGLESYRSIYTDAKRRTNLAFAIREGCADFLTWQVTGKSIDNRRDYVKANERELWAEFQPILNAPINQAAAWFGPRDASRPKQPMQVGYGIGMAICETFHDAAADKAQAMRTIYGAYLPEHFEAILAPYVVRMGR